MLGIKEIARRTGYAISTVSLAINNSPRVSDKAREAILKVAKEIDYYPNIAARNLKKSKTSTIGIFLRYFSGPYYNDIINSIQKELDAKDYELILGIMDGKRGYSTVLDFIISKRIDGAIIFGASFIPEDTLKHIKKKKVPLILFDVEPSEFDDAGNKHSSVVLDNYGATFQAISFLINRGKKTIGFIQGQKGSYDNKERFRAYIDVLKTNDIPLNKAYILHCDFAEEIAYNQLNTLTKKNNLPDAFFCANDQMAMGAIRALQDNNIEVPEQVSIFGFDNIELSSMINPTLSTVAYDRALMGKTAVETLLNIIEDKEYPPQIHIPTELIHRQSVS